MASWKNEYRIERDGFLFEVNWCNTVGGFYVQTRWDNPYARERALTWIDASGLPLVTIDEDEGFACTMTCHSTEAMESTVGLYRMLGNRTVY